MAPGRAELAQVGAEAVVAFDARASPVDALAAVGLRVRIADLVAHLVGRGVPNFGPEVETGARACVVRNGALLAVGTSSSLVKATPIVGDTLFARGSG